MAAETGRSLRGKVAAEGEARDAAVRCGGGCSAVGHGEIVARRCAGAGFAVRTASRRRAAAGAGGVLMKTGVNRIEYEPGMRGVFFLTDLQQASAQQVSPATQKVSEQQTEPLGMQKGGSHLDLGIQQVSVSPGQSPLFFVLVTMLSHLFEDGERGRGRMDSPSGLKHSQRMSRAPRSWTLLGKTHASPTDTFR